MILPKQRDPRFITIRRGGTLTDTHHHLLALWAASCAEHVLHLFEQASDDDRPRQAIALTRAWVNGEITMKEAHNAAFATNAAAKGLPDAARFAALAAGQAVAVAHVAAHELGAAAYAIRAAMESVPENEKKEMGRKECQWQREQLPDAIRELVLDDQQLRNNICWFVFSL
ncbi:putative immunity protein [Chitinophaga sp. RCC_12]|uniref:putative immunity protein n=1 Tax=Chitinophaga sp. RCC_12 TaxID=3239226 RepID=UPI0035267A1E